MSLELVTQIEWQNGIERYSVQGLSGKTKFYDARILTFGGSDRSIPVVPGDFSAATLSLSLNNSDGHFNKKKAATPFFGTIVRVYLGDTISGESDFDEIFTGRINSYRLTTTVCDLVIADSRMQILDAQVRIVVSSDYFPDVPEADATKKRMVPIVIGTVSSSAYSARGAVPAYLIDPAVSQSKYRYVAGRGVLKLIDNVYRYGEVVAPANYVITRTHIGSYQYTFIDFTSDQRDTARKDDVEISWDGIGLTDDGTVGGDSITNPSDQVKEFLLMNGFVSADLDLTAFSAAVTRLNALALEGNTAIFGERITIRDVMLKFAASFNMYFFPSWTGKLAIFVPNPKPSSVAGLTRVRDGVDIVRGSLELQPPEEMANTIQVRYAQAFDGDYDVVADINDYTQEVKQGGRRITSAVDLPYIRTASYSLVISMRLFFLREERQVISIETNFNLYREIDIGDNILLSHYMGATTDGVYDDHVFMVIGTGFVIDGDAIKARLKLVDLELTVESGEKEWYLYGAQYAPIFMNTYYAADNFLQSTEDPILTSGRPFTGI